MTLEFVIFTIALCVLKLIKAIRDDEVTILDFLAALYAIGMGLFCVGYYIFTGTSIFT